MALEKIKELVAKQLNIAVDTINENSRLVEDLGADSLDIIEMLMTFEEEFNITIPDEETQNLQTIGAIAEYCNAHGASK